MGAANDRPALKAAVDEWTYSMSAAGIKHGHITDWVTSSVVNMDKMFQVSCAGSTPPSAAVDRTKPMALPCFALPRQGASAFNQPLAWDVSSVKSMEHMFDVRYAAAARIIACGNTAPRAPPHTTQER